MAKNLKESNRQHRSPTSKRSMKHAILLTVISTIIVLLLLYFFFRAELQPVSKVEVAPAPSSIEQKSSSVSEEPQLKRLTGRWERTDADYIIEILKASSDGTLEAGYFNPKTINVGRAEWARDKGDLYVMVELQDANYPGSTYGLQYDQDTDRLIGKYFQAVDESTFDVEFIREKK